MLVKPNLIIAIKPILDLPALRILLSYITSFSGNPSPAMAPLKYGCGFLDFLKMSTTSRSISLKSPAF